MKKKKRTRKKRREISPVTMLTEELAALHRDLRRTIRAYGARLETDLAESAATVASSKRVESLSREAVARNSRSDNHAAQTQTET
jgi:hypothetical protein